MQVLIKCNYCSYCIKKKNLKKKGEVSHQSTVIATVLTQCKHTECTVPKHCSGSGSSPFH